MQIEMMMTEEMVTALTEEVVIYLLMEDAMVMGDH